ncbi:ATP-binding protein [Streptomyces griseocarneus]|nr:ATP-binding protein [Streptomyces griseocarneus]
MEQTVVTSNLASVIRRWPHQVQCVRRARGELSKALADWGLSGIEEPALVVLSELLTNAVVHARVPWDREIETRFVPYPDGVRIQVDDADEQKPVPCEQAEEGGRGLHVVESLADSWGVSDRNGVGKSVWALLTQSREGWA